MQVGTKDPCADCLAVRKVTGSTHYPLRTPYPSGQQSPLLAGAPFAQVMHLPVEGLKKMGRINALSVVSKILVAAAGLLVDTLAVNDAVLSGVADKAKPIAVHAGTVLRLLHADSLNADLACLADSILKGASAGIVQVPAADALFAVSGLDIVTFTVFICFETGSIAELLPSLAASERAGDLKAGSAYHNFVFVLAGKTISGEGVVGGAERRHKLAEDPES